MRLIIEEITKECYGETSKLLLVSKAVTLP